MTKPLVVSKNTKHVPKFTERQYFMYTKWTEKVWSNLVENTSSITKIRVTTLLEIVAIYS
jgi:hypothetical protein